MVMATGLLSQSTVYGPDGTVVVRGSLINAYFANREDLDG